MFCGVGMPIAIVRLSSFVRNRHHYEITFPSGYNRWLVDQEKQVDWVIGIDQFINKGR